MDHGLLVARLVVGEQVGVLGKRLTDPGQVAVAEDAKAAFDEAVLDTVALYELGAQKAHERLRHRHSDGGHCGYVGSGSIASRTRPSRSAQAAMNWRNVRTVGGNESNSSTFRPPSV